MLCDGGDIQKLKPNADITELGRHVSHGELVAVVKSSCIISLSIAPREIASLLRRILKIPGVI